MFINVNGTWKSITDMFVNVAGTWKRITDGFVNVAGTWKRFFSSALSIQQQVTISQSTNATTFLTTLTGTNYYWSPGPPVLTYKFQRSTDGGSTWSDLDSGSIVNPAFGSSNTKTYSLASSGPTLGVLPNVLNYYRFRVDATYGSLSANSISSSTTIQGPTNTTISLSDPTYASVSLSWTASTGANRYLVYRSSDNITFSQYASVTSTSLSAISDLAGGSTYYFYVVPITGGSFTYPGYLGNSSNTLTLPILATPTLSSSTSSTSSFSFTINNYDASNTYVLSTTAGSISRSGSSVTVSGLTPGQSATATVRATRSGYGNSDSASRSGSALPEYTVTWNSTNFVGLPGGTTVSVTPSSNTGLSGTVITAPTPTASNSNYNFLYWRDTTNVATFLYSLTAGQSWTINSNITFFSWWQAKTYTVTYNYNGGTGTPASASVQYPGSVTLPTPDARAGYTFNGWYTASSGGSFAGNAGSSYSPTSNITLYAQWTAVTYNVSFDANGGTLSSGPGNGLSYYTYSGVANSTFTVPSATRSGFTFSTWRNPLSGGDPVFATPGTTYTITGSITYWAIWTAANLTAPTITSVSAPSSPGGPLTVYFSGGSGPYYQIWWQSSSDYSSVTSYDANGSSSPLTDSTGPSAGTWYVAVRSVSALTNIGSGPSSTISAWSSPVQFTVSAGTPPATPTGVTNTYNGGTSYTFSWTASSGATSYDINYGENTTAPSPNPPASIVGNVATGTVNTSSTSYNYTSSSSANYVGFRVRANNSNGSSSYSAVTQYK